MKQKFLHSLMTLLSLNVVVSTVSCTKVNKSDWNSISLKPPLLDVDVTGFVGTNLDKIDITKYETVPELISSIKRCLENSLWVAENSTKFTIIKSDKTKKKIIPLDSDELYRKGIYMIKLESKLDNAPGSAKFTIKVVNSNHLADLIITKELDDINDYLPKTILYNIMLRNFSLHQYINEFADYLPLDESLKSTYLDIQIDEAAVMKGEKVSGSAILKNLLPNSNLKFVGQVEVRFKVQLKPLPNNHKKIDLASLVALQDASNWTKLSDAKPYTLLRRFIEIAFGKHLSLHSHIINEIDIIKKDTNKDDVKEVTFKAKDLTKIPTYQKLYGDSYFTNQFTVTVKLENN